LNILNREIFLRPGIFLKKKEKNKLARKKERNWLGFLFAASG
jgi:hypothetical protein